MPLRIQVSGPARADELFAYLLRLGADARREEEAIVVRRRHAPVPGEPASQDRVELEFVVRTWAIGRPDAEFKVEEAA